MSCIVLHVPCHESWVCPDWDCSGPSLSFSTSARSRHMWDGHGAYSNSIRSGRVIIMHILTDLSGRITSGVQSSVCERFHSGR
eukprot:1157000-Prymnesium_polylepis.1